jgi:glycosyltransferase involved in cell wall biosynthesis
MRLLVLIPAFNEEASIADVVGAVPRTLEGIERVDVTVIDDGSSDRTAQSAREAGAEVISHRANRGLGSAFQTGLRHALERAAEIVVTLDGDGQFNPADIPKLVAPLLEGRASVVTASRFADPALVPTMPWVKRWGNARVAALVSRLTGRRYADVSCGFRAYSRDTLLQLTVRGTFTYTHEVFLDLASKGIPIVEVPVAVRGTRQFGHSKVASKIWRYGLRTAGIMLGFLRDTRPFMLLVWCALPVMVAGLAALGYSYAQWLGTDVWLKWAAFLGGSLVAFASMLILLGFLLDFVRRIRENQEETLYWLRRLATRPPDDGSSPGS